MRRIHIELLAAGLIAWGVYRWTRPPVLPAAPPHAPLAAPEPSTLRPRAPESSMRLAPETSVPESRPLGRTPRLIARTGSDDALTPLPPAPPDSGSSWLEWLKSRSPQRKIGAIVALFFVLYVFLVRTLRRGGTGRALTHD